MKQLQLRIQVPFSWYLDRAGLQGGPLWKKPDSRLLHAYALALKQEIEASGDGMEDVEVTEISFGGGIAGMLSARDIQELMRAIRRTFSVKEGAEALLTLFPGSLDLNVVNTYREAKINRLLFEVPSLIVRECRELDFPDTLPALDMTNYVLQSMRFSEFGFRAISGVAGRTKERWENMLRQIGHYGPQFLEFYPLDLSVDDGGQYPELTSRLQSAGYEKAGERRFVRKGFCVDNFRAEQEHREYLGIGLGAESCMDGYRTRNTRDMQTYLADSGDFQKILTEVQAQD